MVLTGLFAAFGHNETAKWGWYAMACIAYLIVVWQLAVNGRATAYGKGGKVGAFFASIAGFTLVLWTAYPVSSSATPNSDTWFLTLHRSSGVLQMAPVSRPLVRR